MPPAKSHPGLVYLLGLPACFCFNGKTMYQLEIYMRTVLVLLLTALGAGGAAAQASSADRNTATQITFLGPKSGWGFVQTACPYYSPQGKKLGVLPGGTPFKYTGVKPSSKNDMLVSSVKRGEAWEGPYLLDCADLAAYGGDPGALEPQTLENLAAYFTIKGKIADREAALAQEALAANPHYESAKQAQRAYQDSVVKAADMEKQMLSLTGLRKAKADDALRAFKYEQVRIKAKADREAAAYKAYKDAHPAAPAARAADPQLRELEQALGAAKAKVKDLVPQS